MLNEIKYFLIKFCSYCNLDCSYCIIHDRKSKEESVIFNQAKQLVQLAKTLPIGPILDIELTGGECSLFCPEIELFMKEMRKLERYKDTKVKCSLVSNGTNLPGLFDLMEKDVLDPWSMKVSWDGIHSSSKVRKPKTKLFNDSFFNNRIKDLGKSKYNKDILVRIALTTETVDDLYDSFKYALDSGCNKIEYYYLYLKDKPWYYQDTEFCKKVEEQLYKLAELYKEYNFDYENWNYLYYTEYLADDKQKLFDLNCEVIGRMLYFTTDGTIYPCGLFSENFFETNIFKLGDLKNGLDKIAINEFADTYRKLELCKASKCGNYHCYKCPAFLYYRKMNNEDVYGEFDFCYLRSIEKKIFLENTSKESFNKKKILKRMNFVHEGPITYDLPSCFRVV